MTADRESPMPLVLVLHGPNLNLLGTREPGIYGSVKLAEIDQALHDLAADAPFPVAVECHQSNHEGVLVDLVQQRGARHHGMPVAFKEGQPTAADFSGIHGSSTQSSVGRARLRGR